MPKFSHFDARVLVDGTQLPEYARSQTVNSDGVTTVSCWVPSEAGKAFSVRWTDTRPAAARPAIAGYVHADGVHLSGACAPAGRTAGDSLVSSKRVGSIRRVLVFSELDLTDDDKALRKGTHEHMGEIHLCIYRVRLLGARPVRDKQMLSSEKVHERSKKAGAHRIQLGAEVSAASTTCERVQHDGPMLIRFVFRYRPLALLKATDIVPLSSRAEITPPAPAVSRPPNHAPAPCMTQDEIDEKKRLEARLEELKRKYDGSPAVARKKLKTKVKVEPPSHAGRFVDGEIIDLSED